VRRAALDRIGGFDTSIEFHGEDTNLGRRLFKVGKVCLA
jgi:GT2 family glycosyltransferase